MKVIISVSQEDIDKGKPDREDACALARAFRRAGFVKPEVGYERVRAKKGKTIYVSTAMPRAASKLIHAFDKNKPVEPVEITFNMREV